MTTAQGDSVAATAADGFASDWKALRADGDIQFAPIELPDPPPTPDWMNELGEFLAWLFGPFSDAFAAAGRLIGLSGQVLLAILILFSVVLLVALAWRYLVPLVTRGLAENPTESDWSPEADEAQSLLEEADRLAAEGRYDEATHLLLKRSVGQIAAARPGLLEPSSTAREIAQLTALSAAARGAFVVIADRVERSLFALRGLTADDWQAARTAYAEFALAGPRLV